MKILSRLFLFLLSLTLTISCGTLEKSVEITNLDCNYPMTLRFNPGRTKALVKVAYAIKIKNKSLKRVRFNSSSLSNFDGTLVYKPSEDGFEFIENLSEDLSPFESQIYIVETRGRYIGDLQNDPQLKEYLEKIEGSSENTLTVGTFKEFKEKHPQILNKIAPNDTLKLGFKDVKSGAGFSILHPVSN